MFLRDTDARITLYLRRTSRLPNPDQITQKGQPIMGHDVSLNSLSVLIVKLALTPGMERRHSVGVSRG